MLKANIGIETQFNYVFPMLYHQNRANRPLN